MKTIVGGCAYRPANELCIKELKEPCRMKTIAILYGGDATSRKYLYAGDMMSIELLDTAVTLLMGNDYLKSLKKKNNKVMIKMSKMQYKSIKINNISLLFTNYFDTDRLTLFDDGLKFDGDIIISKSGVIKEAIVSLGNKQVKILTSVI